MLAPPPGGFDNVDSSLPVKAAPKSNGSPPEEVPLLTREPEPTNEDTPKDGKVIKFFKFLYVKLKLKQILQPPIIASILAIFIGCVPFLKGLIFTPDAPLYFFTDTCLILWDAMIPCILLALGGNLTDGPRSAKLGLRTTTAIMIGRLILFRQLDWALFSQPTILDCSHPMIKCSDSFSFCNIQCPHLVWCILGSMVII